MPATNEDRIQDLLVQVRSLVQKLTPQAEQHRIADYEIVTSLIGAAEAVIGGLVDERVLLALDMLAEMLQSDLEELPVTTEPVASSPTVRSVLSA